MHSNLGELHNFLDTCRMGTPLRVSKALRTCKRHLGYILLGGLLDGQPGNHFQ
jgi:hypothetical protein